MHTPVVISPSWYSEAGARGRGGMHARFTERKTLKLRQRQAGAEGDTYLAISLIRQCFKRTFIKIEEQKRNKF